MPTTFSAHVENKFWVLARISRLFSRMMFNIHSLTVAQTTDPNVSCMTIEVDEPEDQLKRVELELSKISTVLSVDICHEDDYVEGEMILVKVQKSSPTFSEVVNLANKHQAHVIYRHEDVEIFEFTLDKAEVDSFLEEAKTFNPVDIVQTGTLAMTKTLSGLETITKSG